MRRNLAVPPFFSTVSAPSPLGERRVAAAEGRVALFQGRFNLLVWQPLLFRPYWKKNGTSKAAASTSHIPIALPAHGSCANVPPPFLPAEERMQSARAQVLDRSDVLAEALRSAFYFRENGAGPESCLSDCSPRLPEGRGNGAEGSQEPQAGDGPVGGRRCCGRRCHVGRLA